MAHLLISEFCKAKGISIIALAEKTGLSRNTIAGIINGQQNTTIATLELIAQALDVELADLIRSDRQKGSLTCPSCGARLSVRLTAED